MEDDQLQDLTSEIAYAAKPRFIEVNRKKVDGTSAGKLLLNIGHLVGIREEYDGDIVLLMPGWEFRIMETYDQVVKAILHQAALLYIAPEPKEKKQSGYPG